VLAARVKAQRLEHYLLRGHLARGPTVRSYLASTDEPRLQIGSGPELLDGWLNSDVVCGDVHLDLTRPLPFPDGSFAYVFGEHVIEHIPEPFIADLLSELRRVLRRGGVLRLTSPDLPKLISLYEDRNPAMALADYAGDDGRRSTPCRLFNDAVRGFGHFYIYDEPELTLRLTAAGFRHVERFETGESRHKALRGIERHGDAMNRAEAMCLEAVVDET